MNMKDVKAITIPQGTVKKIENSNGDIIWGSQDAFPYRRLEYIDMYGKYYNTYNRPAKGFYFLDVKINTTNPLNSNDSYGIPFGCSGSSSRRLFFGGDGTKLFQRLKTNADTQVSAWNNLNSNTKYQIRLRTYATNNTAGTFWFALQNLDNDSQVYGQYYNNTTYAMNLAELPYFFINAHGYNSSGTSATPQTLIHKGAVNFKVYRFFVKEDDDSSNIKWDFYPVQRKSDGRVGFYNVKTGTFSEIQNSDDSYVDTITEPVADEYWDLTTPS